MNTRERLRSEEKFNKEKALSKRWRPGTIIRIKYPRSSRDVFEGLGMVVAVYNREFSGRGYHSKERHIFVVWDSHCEVKYREYRLDMMNFHILYTVKL